MIYIVNINNSKNTKNTVKAEKKKTVCKSCKREYVNINIHLKKSFACIPSYAIISYEEVEKDKVDAFKEEEAILTKNKAQEETYIT